MSTCHYRRHLRGSCLSVYELALGFSSAGLFFAGIDRICLETGYARDTVSTALAKLCRDGWLESLGGNFARAKQGGRFQPNSYQVVSHDEWVVVHPGVCETPTRGRKVPSREKSVPEGSAFSVTEESGLPVTGKPPHITSVGIQVEPNESDILVEPSGSRGEKAHPNGFDEFWTAYPRKRARQAALRAFGKLKADSGLSSEILKALEIQKSSADWKEKGGRYIPYPASWLNDRRWEDEVTSEAGARNGSEIKQRRKERFAAIEHGVEGAMREDPA